MNFISLGIIPGSLIAVGAVLALLGVALLRLARRARRGDEPHCRGCEYLLIGIHSARCPECGRELSQGNVVFGNPRLNRSRALQAFAFTLLASACFWGASTRYVRSIDYYNYWPTVLVLRDVSQQAPASVLRAWNELAIRRAAGKLSGRYEQQLIDIALAEAAKPPGTWGPLHDEMLEHLAELVSDGKLSSAQADLFFQRITRQSLQVRPSVLEGHRIWYRIGAPYYWASKNGWQSRQVLVAIEIDGVLAHPEAVDWNGSDQTLTLPPSSVGDHVITAKWRFALFRPGTDPQWNGASWVGEFSLKAPVRVVADLKAEGLVELDRPDLLSTIRSRIKVRIVESPSFEIGLSSMISVGAILPPLPTVVVVVTADNLPCNIAFEVYLREGTQERLAGTITLAKGRAGDFVRSIPNFRRTSVQGVDLILRSSPKAARDSINMEFWKGEIVFSHVRFQPKGESGFNAMRLPSPAGGPQIH